MTALVKRNAPSQHPPQTGAGWIESIHLLANWLEHRERVDEIMLAASARLHGVERAHCQSIVMGVVRHHGRLEQLVRRRLQHPPRRLVEAILFAGGFELIEQPPERAAKVVHYCVERTKRLASPAESRLVNAVLRRVSEDLMAQPAPGKLAAARELADYYSHPEWLVSRWLALFGGVSTRALLEWNSQPGEIHVRLRPGAGQPEPWMHPTEWQGFHRVSPGCWKEVEDAVKAGRIFIQDPATRMSVDLLDPRPGETVIDLCAAPGGKSVAIADRMGSGTLVAVDLPGQRQTRLAENLGRVRSVTIHRVAADLFRGLEQALSREGLPQRFEAVCLDVPCSNTGVMRHRVDVKERLQPGDFTRHAAQQLRMLEAASRMIAPGGRIVYSTCSIDPEENEKVVESFLGKRAGEFVLADSRLGRPWEHRHDGAGVFLLRRMT